MELTDKVYWDFRNWLYDTHGIKPKFIDDLGDRLFESFLIDWLDTVGIYITILRVGDIYPWRFNINGIIYCGTPNIFNTRQEATERAITKANEIYNETN